MCVKMCSWTCGGTCCGLSLRRGMEDRKQAQHKKHSYRGMCLLSRTDSSRHLGQWFTSNLCVSLWLCVQMRLLGAWWWSSPSRQHKLRRERTVVSRAQSCSRRLAAVVQYTFHMKLVLSCKGSCNRELIEEWSRKLCERCEKTCDGISCDVEVVDGLCSSCLGDRHVNL